MTNRESHDRHGTRHEENENMTETRPNRERPYASFSGFLVK